MAIFTNQATLTYQNTTTSSNIATGELLEVLSATKTAVTETYTTGTDVTYVISILNSGTTPISGISVNDDLGAYPFGTTTLVPLDYVDGSVRLFVNGVLQTAPTVTESGGVTFSGITVPAGGNAILLYEASANNLAPLGVDASITNTATVSASALTAVATATETSIGAKKAAEAGTIVVFRLWNQGCDDGKNNLSLHELKKHFPNEWEEHPRGIKLADKVYLEWGERFEWPDQEASVKGDRFFCYGLKDHFGILVDGTVVPCCLDSEGTIALGNIFSTTLDHILTSKRATALIDGFRCGKASEPLCQRCGYAQRFV